MNETLLHQIVHHYLKLRKVSGSPKCENVILIIMYVRMLNCGSRGSSIRRAYFWPF